MASRLALSENVIYRIYQHYCYLKSKLFDLYLFPVNGNRAVEQRRSGLEKQLDFLKQEKRQEQVQCWQDVAVLRVESRQWAKQHGDLLLRVRLVSGVPERPKHHDDQFKRKPIRHIHG